MSAILFSNPFAPPPAPPSAQPAVSGLTLGAIAPAAASVSSQGPNLSGNTGSELSRQAETVALFQKRQSFERPATATGDSIINAQTQSEDTGEDTKLGPDLPEVEMPDPLPTSPILLQMREAS